MFHKNWKTQEEDKIEGAAEAEDEINRSALNLFNENQL